MLELKLEKKYSGYVVGVDEAGRGPWAGPVVAASVRIHQCGGLEAVNDSKKLSEARREALFEQIHHCADVGVGVAQVEEIDQYNILEATKLAMCRAVEALPASPSMVLVDGNQLPRWSYQAEAIIKGDAKCLSIAAASIIAKVTRDRMMKQLAQEYPYYAWEKNAGYGTKAHQEGLKHYGVTPHHRKSFKPVKALL